MNILCLSNTSDLYGASRCLERVFGRLARRGHVVHVVVPEDGPILPLMKAQGIEVHIQPGLSVLDRSQLKTLSGCLRFVLGFPVSIFQISRLIRRHKIDLVHTNTGVLPSGSLAALLTRRPHVWHIRELLAEFKSLWAPYQRYIASTSSAIVVISKCTRDQFAPANRLKMHVIYDGLDEEVAQVDPVRRDQFRSQFPQARLLVGCIGRIKWHRKGQEILVQAATLLKDNYPDVHYVLVGSTAPGNEEHETRLKDLIHLSGLDSRFTFTGDTADPVSVFAAFDIAVVPSVQTEPFGCVVIEAMSAGTAVIGSDCGGIAEQIVHGESGLLFPPGDGAELAKALVRLFEDEAYRRRLAMQGLDRVRSAFSLDSTCSQMLSVLSSVA